jgi:hypothetical protein
MYHPNPNVVHDEGPSVLGLQRSVQEARVVNASKLESLPTPSTLVSGGIGEILSEPVPRDLASVVGPFFFLLIRPILEFFLESCELLSVRVCSGLPAF